MNLIKGYIGFLRDNKVMGMAIAVIVGLKLSALFTSLVNDVLMPGLFHWSLLGVKQWDHDGIMFSNVIGTGLEFFLVAFLIYVIFKYVLGVKPNSTA
jgi:large-conductance mechanosensitive channel